MTEITLLFGIQPAKGFTANAQGTYLIDGKNITAFSNAEEDNYAKADVPFMLESALRSNGAKYSSVEAWLLLFSQAILLFCYSHIQSTDH